MEWELQETCQLPDLGTENLTLQGHYELALVTKAFALIPVSGDRRSWLSIEASMIYKLPRHSAVFLFVSDTILLHSPGWPQTH